MKPDPADLYSLSAAHEVRAAGGPVKMLQAQIRRGFHTLHFADALERDFCRYLRVSGRLSRSSLVLVSLLGMFLIILIDQTALGLPDALFVPTRIFEVGLMLPTILFCGLFCWYWPYSRYIEGVMLILFVGMNVGMVGQRVVASYYGFDVPIELLGVTIVAMFSLARIRFWLMLPAAIIAFIALLVIELLLVDTGTAAYYHLFSAVLLLAIGVMGGYSSEYFIRWTWINGTLLHYMSRLDSLTGLLNRQALDGALQNAVAHAYREKIGFAIAMVDIDAFGAYNNYYGHQAGDDALCEVARTLELSARRPIDVCGRFGGEEFALLWMDGHVPELGELAEQARIAIERLQIEHEVSSVAPWVTVSIGLCQVEASAAQPRLEDVLAQADQLLYAAKANGRNRVISGRFEDVGEQTGLERRAMVFGGR